MTHHPFFPATLDTATAELRANAQRLIAQAQACAALARFGAEHKALRMFAAQVEDAVSENLGSYAPAHGEVEDAVYDLRAPE
jgi:hypothetical protein